MAETTSKAGVRTWDPRQMYDVTPEEKKAMEERARMRAQLKAEWQKKVTNPYRGVQGHLFDPALQRFTSMRANHWEQFRAAPKTVAIGFFFSLGPILFLWYQIDKSKRTLEQKCRTGQIAYKDREWKFI